MGQHKRQGNEVVKSWAGRRSLTFAAKPPTFLNQYFIVFTPILSSKFFSMFALALWDSPCFFLKTPPPHVYGCFSIADSNSAGVACFLLQPNHPLPGS